MKRILALIILGSLLVPEARATGAASVPSDWPSFGADAALSNYNAGETILKASNVLKLKVRWTSRVADESYPIVEAGHVYVPLVYKGKIHLRIVDAGSGSKLGAISREAVGGPLYVNGTVYVAGHSLQAIDSTGAKTGQIKSGVSNGTFAYPEWNGKMIVSGYAGPRGTDIYTIDPTTNQVAHKLASSSAVAAMLGSRIVTNTQTGSAIYGESSGQLLARPSYFGSYWFASGQLAYTVASVNGKATRVYAVDQNGHTTWSRVVAPALATQGAEWAHAAGPNGLYVATLRPHIGVQALDPATGHVLWTRSISDVQRLALANNLLFVLTYGLGQRMRLVVLNAKSGKVIGGIVLSAGFFTFSAPNQLMVANGMVFIRATGPGGPELVAMGLPK